MVEIVWTLLIVFAIEGDGSGYIHTERFAPYLDRAACEEAAAALTQPVFAVNSTTMYARAYCVPGGA